MPALQLDSRTPASRALRVLMSTPEHSKWYRVPSTRGDLESQALGVIPSPKRSRVGSARAPQVLGSAPALSTPEHPECSGALGRSRLPSTLRAREHSDAPDSRALPSARGARALPSPECSSTPESRVLRCSWALERSGCSGTLKRSGCSGTPDSRAITTRAFDVQYTEI